MISDRDVWQAAVLLVKRYGDDAMLEAAERADKLLDEGDMAGAETWHRILKAIERLHAKTPAEGRRCIDQGAAGGAGRARLQEQIANFLTLCARWRHGPQFVALSRQSGDHHHAVAWHLDEVLRGGLLLDDLSSISGAKSAGDRVPISSSPCGKATRKWPPGSRS